MTQCSHLDAIKLAEQDGRRALACFECGRLFGWLDQHERFVAFNPAKSSDVGQDLVPGTESPWDDPIGGS